MLENADVLGVKANLRYSVTKMALNSYLQIHVV